MSTKKTKSSKIRPSIKKDGVSASDFLRYNLIYACEQCSHFQADTEKCTLGFVTEPHLKRNQLKTFELSGKMAFCRFQEID